MSSVLESVVDEDLPQVGLQELQLRLRDPLVLVGLEMLPHVVPLDELAMAEGAAVGLLAAVDLPVAVQRAGVGQLLEADLALHHGLAVRA